jgi:phosphoenolpyruvate---glycerone phosphotransferase subunit DhaM
MAQQLVGIVVVSHSALVARGVAELAGAMAGPAVRIIPTGGEGDGRLGVVTGDVVRAIEAADTGAGVLVMVDLGNAVHAAELAIELMPPSAAAVTRVSRGPLVEGTIIAAVQASIGESLDEVAKAAEDALRVKLDR